MPSKIEWLGVSGVHGWAVLICAWCWAGLGWAGLVGKTWKYIYE